MATVGLGTSTLLYCVEPISGSSLLDAGTAARKAGNLFPKGIGPLYLLLTEAWPVAFLPHRCGLGLAWLCVGDA